MMANPTTTAEKTIFLKRPEPPFTHKYAPTHPPHTYMYFELYVCVYTHMTHVWDDGKLLTSCRKCHSLYIEG